MQARFRQCDDLNHLIFGSFFFLIFVLSLQQIRNEKVTVKAKSKVGSLDNSSYTPGGGNVKVGVATGIVY